MDSNDHPVTDVGASQSRLASLPEQGQLVEVRRRQFVVADVSRSALPTGTDSVWAS
jgi:hypothetical protein